MTTTKITYKNVRRIDGEDGVPDTCDMASPDGGECDRDPDFVFGLEVNGKPKDGPLAACEGCFQPPDEDLPATFSETLTDSDLRR